MCWSICCLTLLLFCNAVMFLRAVELLKQSQAGFADCMILAESLDIKSLLYAFDKRLGKHPNTQLL